MNSIQSNANVWGNQLANIAKQAPQFINNNVYLAAAVITSVNALFMGAMHLLISQMEKMIDNRKLCSLPSDSSTGTKVKVVMIDALLNVILPGASVLAFNLALSKMTRFPLSKTALAIITSTCVALRIILKVFIQKDEKESSTEKKPENEELKNKQNPTDTKVNRNSQEESKKKDQIDAEKKSLQKGSEVNPQKTPSNEEIIDLDNGKQTQKGSEVDPQDSLEVNKQPPEALSTEGKNDLDKSKKPQERTEVDPHADVDTKQKKAQEDVEEQAQLEAEKKNTQDLAEALAILEAEREAQRLAEEKAQEEALQKAREELDKRLKEENAKAVQEQAAREAQRRAEIDANIEKRNKGIEAMSLRCKNAEEMAPPSFTFALIKADPGRKEEQRFFIECENNDDLQKFYEKFFFGNDPAEMMSVFLTKTVGALTKVTGATQLIFKIIPDDTQDNYNKVLSLLKQLSGTELPEIEEKDIVVKETEIPENRIYG